MKKGFIFTLLAAVLSINAFALDIVQTKASFKTDVNSLELSPDPNNSTTLYATGSSNNYNLLSKYGNVDIHSSLNRISLTKVGEYNLQCVAFVKAVTNAIGTSSWRKGSSITPLTNLPAFTPIAVFDTNGRYNHVHTGLLMRVSNTGIYILDQNHKGTAENPIGQIASHFIPFDNSKPDYSNAYKFSVIMQ